MVDQIRRSISTFLCTAPPLVVPFGRLVLVGAADQEVTIHMHIVTKHLIDRFVRNMENLSNTGDILSGIIPVLGAIQRCLEQFCRHRPST